LSSNTTALYVFNHCIITWDANVAGHAAAIETKTHPMTNGYKPILLPRFVISGVRNL